MAISSRKQYEQVSSAIRRVRLNAIHDIVVKYQRYQNEPKSNWEVQQAAAGIDKVEADEVNSQFDKLVNALAEIYAKDNPAFDDARFRRACGYSS